MEEGIIVKNKVQEILDFHDMSYLLRYIPINKGIILFLDLEFETFVAEVSVYLIYKNEDSVDISISLKYNKEDERNLFVEEDTKGVKKITQDVIDILNESGMMMSFEMNNYPDDDIYAKNEEYAEVIDNGYDENQPKILH